MEKIIELLNEYLETFDTETNKTLKAFAFEEATKSFLAENGASYRQERVISKRFKFIKWLVEKNKIDLDKLKGNITFTSIWVCFDLRTVKEWESIIKAIWTNTIIAYLSIQDKPIEFLISILK